VARFDRILLKLSGQTLAGGASFGIDAERVRALASEIAEVARAGVQLGLVVVAAISFGRGRRRQEHGPGHRRHHGHAGHGPQCAGPAGRPRAAGGAGPGHDALEMPQVAEPYIRGRPFVTWRRAVWWSLPPALPSLLLHRYGRHPARPRDPGQLVAKGTRVDGVYDQDPLKYSDAVSSEISYAEVLTRALGVLDGAAVAYAARTSFPCGSSTWNSRQHSPRGPGRASGHADPPGLV